MSTELLGTGYVPYTSQIAQFNRSLPDLAENADTGLQNPLRVLLYEQNDFLRQCMTALLNHYKYMVACARNNCEAMAYARQFSPHAVILSSNFRSPTDFALCKELRSIPETAASIFLGITGHYFEDMHRIAKSAGFDRYYLKPVPLTTFMSVLNSMLECRSPVRKTES
jgi:DNA-binding response OmpR family regulator